VRRASFFVGRLDKSMCAIDFGPKHIYSSAIKQPVDTHEFVAMIAPRPVFSSAWKWRI
jgi:hypothetical protein